MYVRLPQVKAQETEAYTVTKFGTRDALQAVWCAYDFGFKRSKVKVAGRQQNAARADVQNTKVGGKDETR